MGLSTRLLWAFSLIVATSTSAIAADEEALPKGDPERGETLYLRYCRGCHGEDGRGDALVFMPHVNNLTKTYDPRLLERHSCVLPRCMDNSLDGTSTR